MIENNEEILREPLRSRAIEIAEEQNMSFEEFVEYVVRRYIDDFYGTGSEEEFEEESSDEA